MKLTSIFAFLQLKHSHCAEISASPLQVGRLISVVHKDPTAIQISIKKLAMFADSENLSQFSSYIESHSGKEYPACAPSHEPGKDCMDLAHKIKDKPQFVSAFLNSVNFRSKRLFLYFAQNSEPNLLLLEAIYPYSYLYFSTDREFKNDFTLKIAKLKSDALKYLRRPLRSSRGFNFGAAIVHALCRNKCRYFLWSNFVFNDWLYLASLVEITNSVLINNIKLLAESSNPTDIANYVDPAYFINDMFHSNMLKVYGDTWNTLVQDKTNEIVAKYSTEEIADSEDLAEDTKVAEFLFYVRNLLSFKHMESILGDVLLRLERARPQTC